MRITDWKPAKAEKVLNYFNMLRETFPTTRPNMNVFVSYLLWVYKKRNCKPEISFQEFVNNYIGRHSDLGSFIKDQFNEKAWEALKKIVDTVDLNMLETVILDTTGAYAIIESNFTTPHTLSELVIRLLDIRPGHGVCDICAGAGNFLTSAVMEQPAAEYMGREINSTAYAVLDIRERVLSEIDPSLDIHTDQWDIFDFVGGYLVPEDPQWNDVLEEDCYDRLFGNYPWGLSIKNYIYGPKENFAAKMMEQIPGIETISAGDWLFNMLMVTMMKDSGRAVGIMANGSTWNMTEGCRNARRYFLEHGLIESVIALPPKVFKNTSIATTMIVLSHGNTKVRMVDATHMCTEEMRQNIFSGENIRQILEACRSDGEYSVTVDPREIIEKFDTVIHPSRFLAAQKPVKDGKPLGSVLKGAYRGASITAKELDALYTEKTTNSQYVKLQNINDGLIDEELPYLSEIPQKYEKFCIPNHAMVLSKFGVPSKCAIADVKGGKKLLATGNLFILEIDEEKANPYYLKALFESSYGAGLLSNISYGSVISTISMRGLEKMLIPLPSMEKQNQIANEYLAIQDEIKIYRRKLAGAVDRKQHIFDELQED